MISSVLLLGNQAVRLADRIRPDVKLIAYNEAPIVDARHFDLVISFGYRHIIQYDTLANLKRPALNCHISLLPWNRGSDPNLWSWLEDTPKGITIHEMTDKLDDGPIVAQREYAYSSEFKTLSTSYDFLIEEMCSMFSEMWTRIRDESYIPWFVDNRFGSSHKTADKLKYMPLLTNGWDTPVKELIGKAL